MISPGGREALPYMSLYGFVWVNSVKTHDTLLQVKKQNYKGEIIIIIRKSIIFLKSSPEAIVCLVQKVLITSETKQKITPDHSPECCGNSVYAKIRPEWINQSNGSIGGPLGFVTDSLNTSAPLYRLPPCLTGKDIALFV